MQISPSGVWEGEIWSQLCSVSRNKEQVKDTKKDEKGKGKQKKSSS